MKAPARSPNITGQLLELENQRLRKQETLLKEERNRLQHTNEATRQKVAAMITRLKSLEQQT